MTFLIAVLPEARFGQREAGWVEALGWVGTFHNVGGNAFGKPIEHGEIRVYSDRWKVYSYTPRDDAASQSVLRQLLALLGDRVRISRDLPLDASERLPAALGLRLYHVQTEAKTRLGEGLMEAMEAVFDCYTEDGVWTIQVPDYPEAVAIADVALARLSLEQPIMHLADRPTHCATPDAA